MLKMAIPNKGALSEDAVRLLGEAGYKCSRSGRELVVSDRVNEIDFVFLRPRDIALYVGNGVLDLGITGRDLRADSGAQVVELMPLGFGRSRFCFAVPKGSGLTVETLGGLRIATSYPELLRQNLEKRGLKCPIVRLDGAVEISIRLGVADAIADVVESGATLREAGLEIIGEPMLHSEAVLIGRSAELQDCPEVKKLTARLKGIIVAGSYAMMEYDIPRSALDAACAITPGIESPTVAPLSNPDWVAVKAMVLRKECNRIMDELYDIGARGIIVADIRSCRL
ncbi:ATP phosphoribosyltransferase [uncultured Victivallis sp.]|uniref:ATP phosphoribosyltransferase n=1 Tax=uncultured Victivallis sp. TaxID=354118 RepID=UPI0025F55C3A|nr:ATP phosphoribosyltransferase [uncultured Victivallis sp.]